MKKIMSENEIQKLKEDKNLQFSLLVKLNIYFEKRNIYYEINESKESINNINYISVDFWDLHWNHWWKISLLIGKNTIRFCFEITKVSNILDTFVEKLKENEFILSDIEKVWIYWKVYWKEKIFKHKLASKMDENIQKEIENNFKEIELDFVKISSIVIELDLWKTKHIFWFKDYISGRMEDLKNLI